MVSMRLVRWAIAIAAAIGIVGLSVGNAAAAGCGDSWNNSAGGAWATGANWSTGAPPTSSQSACITIALSGPVVLSSSTSVGSLTLGGSSGTDELEFNGGQTMTIGGSSTIADTGLLTNENGTLTIDQTGTLTNEGVIIPASGGLAFVGNLTNAADGLIMASSAELAFGGPGKLTNDGVLSLSGNAALVAPHNGGSGATIINGGTIQNTSTTPSTIGAGATLEETAGTTVGTPVQIDGGTLQLNGNGAAQFELTGDSTLHGNVAKAQTLYLNSADVVTTGSVTNSGTITDAGFGVTLTVPSGDTLTNDGSISASPTFNMAGNLVNAASGRIAVLDSFVVYGPVTLTNEGTISVSPGADLHFNASSESGPFGTIDNAGGTIQNGGEVGVSSGQTFDEGAGATTGNLISLSGGGALNLQGSGASQFVDDGTASGTISGNIAANQVVKGSLYPTGSFTNNGTLIMGAVHMPTGDTLTNDGTIDINNGGTQMFGNLDNTASGVIGEQGSISLQAADTTFTNAGTIYLLFSGGLIALDGCDCGADNNQFINTGTLYVGVAPNSSQWGGQTLASSIGETQSETVDLGGTIVPVPVNEPPPPPTPPNTLTYGITGNPGKPPAWTLTCGAAIGGGWALNCTNQAELIQTSNTSAIPTEISVKGSGTCNGSGACSSTYGQTVTLTATISAQSGAAPTGNVTFFTNVEPQAGTNPTLVPGDVLGTAPLSTSGGVTTATLTLNDLPPTFYEIEAVYPGNASDLAASSELSDLTQEVSQATTTTKLTDSPGSPVFGKTVTLTATVTPSLATPGGPTGYVSFMAGNTWLGATPVTTSNGRTTATFTTTILPVGATSFTADYGGDYNYASSDAAGKSATIGAATAPSTVTVTGPSSVAAGSTYTATTTTNGTGAMFYSFAANPAVPTGMTISSSSGKVTYKVPSTGVTSFSYAVVAANVAGRAESSVVNVTVT